MNKIYAEVQYRRMKTKYPNLKCSFRKFLSSVRTLPDDKYRFYSDKPTNKVKSCKDVLFIIDINNDGKAAKLTGVSDKIEYLNGKFRNLYLDIQFANIPTYFDTPYVDFTKDEFVKWSLGSDVFNTVWRSYIESGFNNAGHAPRLHAPYRDGLFLEKMCWLAPGHPVKLKNSIFNFQTECLNLISQYDRLNWHTGFIADIIQRTEALRISHIYELEEIGFTSRVNELLGIKLDSKDALYKLLEV